MFYSLIALLLTFLLIRWLHPVHSYVINVYFGVPGSGKTTFAAWLVRWCNSQSFVITFAYWLMFHWPFYGSRFRWLRHNFVSDWILSSGWWKRKIDVYSNVPITGSYQIDAKHDLGTRWIADGKLIIDEAGVEFNNRDFKSFSKDAIYFFKYHRHFRLSVDVFSQSFEDMDVTIRRLARTFFVVKKSLLPGFIVIKRIRRKVGIDENTHQIIDHYYFGFPLFDSKWVFCPPLWKLFNSYSCKQLPVTPFEKW